VKTKQEIEKYLEQLSKEYESENAYGQTVYSQKIQGLCWVLGIDYNKYAPTRLYPFDNSVIGKKLRKEKE